MTMEELKSHCQKQIKDCEMWARCKGEEPHGKVYEEHKLILELLEQETKTGHWRAVHQGDEVIDYRCSECEFGSTFGKSTYRMNYCPNCGCHMIESQEREE